MESVYWGLLNDSKHNKIENRIWKSKYFKAFILSIFMDVCVPLSGHRKCISYCGLVSKSPESHCNEEGAVSPWCTCWERTRGSIRRPGSGHVCPEPEARTISKTTVATLTPMPSVPRWLSLRSSRCFLSCDEDKLRIMVSSEGCLPCANSSLMIYIPQPSEILTDPLAALKISGHIGWDLCSFWLSLGKLRKE